MTHDNTSQSLRIGYIGLGDMGQAMALNLAARGWNLIVFDTRVARTEPFTSANVKIARSAREAAAASDIVCICVVDASQVEQVLFGADGVANSMRKDCVVIVHSTIGPDKCRSFADKLKATGLQFIDAPVSGAAVRASKGELTLAVGGDAAIVARCMPLLNDEGSTVVHLGPVGSGQIAKLLNNALFAIQVSFIDEIVSLGAEMGLDRTQLWNVIDSGASGSWASSYYGSQVALANGKHDPASVFGRLPDPDGSLRIITKDVSLFMNHLDLEGFGATRMAKVAKGAIDAIGATPVRA